MRILRTKTFSSVRDSIGEGVRDWVAEKNPRLHEILERTKKEEKEEDDPRNARVKVRRKDKQPLHFERWEPTLVSPYDPPKEYHNWKGEAKNYYNGNVYYKRPEVEEPEEDYWNEEEE